MQPQTQVKIVTLWLALCLLVFTAIMVAGGAARLREGGIALSDIQPFSNLALPAHEERITREFETYKELELFRKYFPAMEIEEFTPVYLLEYTKIILFRLLVPLILFPFLILTAASFIPLRLFVKLACIFACVFLPFPYHTSAAAFTVLTAYYVTGENFLQFLLFALLLWQVLSVSYPHHSSGLELRTPGAGIKLFACIFFVLLSLEILLGSSLNGVHSDLKYNIFPAMEHSFLPEGLFPLSPLYRNLFEDVTTLQFSHRITACVLAVFIIIFWITGRNNAHIAHLLPILFSIFVIQFLLGVLTLLFTAPVRLAWLHQANTILLFAIAVTLMHRLFIPIRRMNY